MECYQATQFYLRARFSLPSQVSCFLICRASCQGLIILYLVCQCSWCQKQNMTFPWENKIFISSLFSGSSIYSRHLFKLYLCICVATQFPQGFFCKVCQNSLKLGALFKIFLFPQNLLHKHSHKIFNLIYFNIF